MIPSLDTSSIAIALGVVFAGLVANFLVALFHQRRRMRDLVSATMLTDGYSTDNIPAQTAMASYPRKFAHHGQGGRCIPT